VQDFSYENEFDLHENKLTDEMYFCNNQFCTKTCFDREVNSRTKVVYWLISTSVTSRFAQMKFKVAPKFELKDCDKMLNLVLTVPLKETFLSFFYLLSL